MTYSATTNATNATANATSAGGGGGAGDAPGCDHRSLYAAAICIIVLARGRAHGIECSGPRSLHSLSATHHRHRRALRLLLSASRWPRRYSPHGEFAPHRAMPAEHNIIMYTNLLRYQAEALDALIRMFTL